MANCGLIKKENSKLLNLTLQGNITKDATVRQAGENQVCSFGVAHNDVVKGEKTTTFVDVSIWGARGVKLAQYLTKGKNVTAVGRLSTREYEGKTYLQLDAQDVAFGGGPAGGAAKEESQAPARDSDDIPF